MRETFVVIKYQSVTTESNGPKAQICSGSPNQAWIQGNQNETHSKLELSLTGKIKKQQKVRQLSNNYMACIFMKGGTPLMAILGSSEDWSACTKSDPLMPPET